MKKERRLYYQYIKGQSLRMLITVVLLCAGFTANSQIYPVKASLNISPPYSVYLSDYSSPGSTKFMTSLYFADLSKPSVNVRFRIKIEGVGIEIKTKESYMGTMVVLPSGIPEVFYGDQLSEYFRVDNLDFSGINEEEFARTGALPEGVYRFSIDVLEYNRGVKISNTASITGWLVLNDPPVLNLPANSIEITSIEPQIIRFQWTPRHKGSPNSSFTTEYKLQIFEIWPEDRNPNDAVNTMAPVFESMTANNYYVYGVAEPQLITGRMYAWQVQAVPMTGTDQLDLFKNNGFSEVKTFRFGQVCDPPETINLTRAHNRELELEWPTTNNATAFTVLFREKVDNAYWYENLSYLPTDRIMRLQPGREYEVQVISNCGFQRSEPSKPFSFSTTNAQNDFVCTPMEFQPDLDNRIPIQILFPGDIITAGDFAIELIEVYRINNSYFGYGLVRFPFLQQLTTNVSFENIRVNTEKKVYEGSVTTVYNRNSRFFMDSATDEESNFLTENEIPPTTNSDLADSSFTDSGFIEVDSIFTTEQGEIIVIVDGEQIAVSSEQLANGEQFQDSNGNTITSSEDGSPIVTQSNSGNGNLASGGSDNPFFDSTYDFDFGPLQVIIAEDQEPKVKEGICEYDNVKVDINLRLEDFGKELNQSIELQSALFSYKKHCETGEFLSGKLQWDNSQGVKSISILDITANLLELEIEVDKDGVSIGKLSFDAGLETDKQIGGMAILRKGLIGEFKFEMNRQADGLQSAFDFKGIENINIELVKQQKVLAQLNNGYLDSEGTLKGNLLLTEEVEYLSESFNLVVKRLNLDISYQLGKEIEILSGNIRILVNDMQLIQGDLVITGSYKEGILETSVTGRNLVSFGMELSDLNLKVDLDKKLNLTIVEGNLKAEHPELGLVLDVDQFSIENGKVTNFNFSGNLNRDGLGINIQEARIDPTYDYLDISAFVEVDQNGIFIAAEFTDFLIYSDGRIQWGEYDLNFDGTKTFGPLTVAIKGASGEKSGTWRKTNAEASMILELTEFGDPLTVTGATISYEKHRRRDHYRNISISVDEANIRTQLDFIDAYLTEIDISLESADDYIIGDGSNSNAIKISSDSYIKFNLSLVEDVSLGKLLFIKEGLSGYMKYDFKGEGLEGALSYEDISNLEIELRKDETILAKLSESSLTNEGVLSGNITALPGAGLTVNGFNLHVDQMEYDIRLPLNEGIAGFEVLSGLGTFSLEGSGALDGKLTIDYSLDELGNVKGQVANSTSLSAFGMELSDFNLAVDLTNKLEFQKIEGNLTARHDAFNSGLLVNNFLLENGQLVSFNLQGDVSYKGFDLKLDNADYIDNSLSISGEVAIDLAGSAAWLAVEELRILSNGDVILNGIAGELDKSPVYVAFSANMEESRFRGEFQGELSGIGVSGAIDLGVAEDAYQFAYLQLAAQGNVPLAGSGLKLTELGGQLGYNYRLLYNDEATAAGNPQEDNYVVGLLLGVSDMANIVEVKGNSVAQFGQDKFELNLKGSLSIPKENTIAKGEVKLNYLMPDNTLDGNVNIDLNVPASNGKVLNANFNMGYSYSGKDWNLSSTNISASLFREVEFLGNIELKGSENSPIKGMLSGQASYDFKYSKEFRALATNFSAQLEAGFNFDGDIIFNEQGVSGKAYLLVYANGELGIVSDIGQYSTLLAVSGASEATLAFESDSARLSGNLIVAISVLGYEHDVKVDIDKQI